MVGRSLAVPVVIHLGGVVVPLAVGVAAVGAEHLVAEHAVGAHAEVEALEEDGEVEAHVPVGVRVAGHRLVEVVDDAVLVEVEDLQVARNHVVDDGAVTFGLPGVDFILVLEDAVGLVGPEVADRIADLGAVHFRDALDDVGAAVDDALIVGDTGDAVLVVGRVHADVVGEVRGTDFVPVERELDTGVAHVTTVDVRGVGAEVTHDRGVHQPVLGVFLIPVERHVQPAVEETGVETEVKLLRSLPGDVGVGQLVGVGAGAGVLGGRARVEGVAAVGRTHRNRRQVLEVVDVAVTVLAPASAEFQEVDDIVVVPPGFVGDDPTGGDGGEGTPAMAAHEVGGTVVTEDQGEHVALVVVVVDTAEEGNQTAVAPGRTGDVAEGRVAGRVAHISVGPAVGPVGGRVARTDAFAEAAVLEGVTDQGVEVVLAVDVEQVVHGIFPGPIPAGVGALADGVGVLEGLVGQLVDHAVLAVGARAQAIVELALPGEALDGLHAQVGRHSQAVVVAAVVAAGRIDHFSDRVGDGGHQVPQAALLEPVVFRIIAVGLKDGNERVGGEHVEDIVPVVVAGTDAAVGRLGEGHVLTHGDDVQAVLVPQHVVGVQADGHTLVVRSDRLAEDTFLVGVAHTHREFGHLGTSDDVDGVVLVGGVDVADGVEPVGSDERTVLHAVVERRVQDAGPVDGRLAHIEVDLVLDVHILLGVQELGHLLHVLDAVEAVIGDADPAGLALLGGDEDDTVRTTRTVDGAGGGVLQDVDALDIRGVEGVDAAAGHAVDHIQRGIGTDGTHTADVDVVARARLSGRTHDAHTGGGGLHGAQGVG